jgi:hypothetical protein
VREIAENEPQRSPREIFERLEREAETLGRDDAPSKRTIGRIRAEHKAVPEMERVAYRYVYWPEAMERGSLPWEASAAVFELLRYCAAQGRRPTVREAFWYWRATLAAPDAPAADRRRVADTLGIFENIPESAARLAEGFLLHRPWTPDGDAAWQAAMASGRLWPAPPPPTEPEDEAQARFEREREYLSKPQEERDGTTGQ